MLAGPLTITTIKDGREKYGRLLGIIRAGSGLGQTSVNEAMVDGGFAKAYDGHGPR
jgi:endonuclease YncB( thermonuclease family)